MKEFEDDEVCAHQLVAKKVMADAEFPNLARIELAEPRTAARETEKR